MAQIINALESSSCSVAGSKAASLCSLLRAGFPVPNFITIPTACVINKDELISALERLGGESFAVRSSSRDEDGTNHSYAGQFATFLHVSISDVAEKIDAVRRSAKSESVTRYTEQKKLPPPSMPAVVVMRMLDAKASGVCFSADPVSGRRSVAVLAACSGTGDQLVSGEVDGENWSVSRDGITSGVDGVISASQAKNVVALAWDCEKHYKCPQDIEWAIDTSDKLWLLQSRPITTLGYRPDPDDSIRVFDNSNIAESYSGVTSPMTFSFAKRIYESVYREFCILLGVPISRINQADDVFPQMLGTIRGRVYYNLLSWYQVLALLPGFNVNRGFMEQMMGVKEPLPKELVEYVVRKNQRNRATEKWELVKTCLGLLRSFCGLEKQIKTFLDRLNSALNTPSLCRMDGEAQAAEYRRLEQLLLKKWDAPLVNDFFAMIFHGVLRALCKKWYPSQTQLANDLLANCGDIISAEPPKRMRRMAKIASQNTAITRLLSANEISTDEKLRVIDSHPELSARKF